MPTYNSAVPAPAPKPLTQLHSTNSTGYQPFSVGNQDFSANPAASQVSISPDILNSMQQYSDAAYHNATRTLDPQWAQQKAAFDQQMVGQGIQSGSDAYNNAFMNFQRGQNDAYSQARDEAMKQGLAAQGQSFQEGLANSNLANELAKAQMSANGSIQSALASAGGQTAAAKINADASIANNQLSNQTSQLLGMGDLGIRAGTLGLGYDQLNQNAGQQDFQDMMQMYGFGNNQDMYNNALPGMQMQNYMGMLGMVPNGNPAMTDVTGAYGIGQSGQNAYYNAASQQANGTNQMLGSLGSAALMAMMFM